LKQFDVKVGDIYKTRTRNKTPFLRNELLRVSDIFDDRVRYHYMSDNWSTTKELRNFTDQYLELPTKLELYLFGATNAKVD
jgi:hypothetical protein